MSLLESKKISVIGCGNMGSSIISGLLQSKLVKAKNILGCDIAKSCLKGINVNSTTDCEKALFWGEIIIIAVKPQQISDLLSKVKKNSAKNKIIISVVAGKRIAFFQKYFNKGTVIIRSMPNTPAIIQEGAVAFAPSKNASKIQIDMAECLLKSIGKVVRVKESQLDAVTALSGSGPAYVFYLAEIMIDAAKKMGLPSEIAQKLVFQTLIGASLLMIGSDYDPSVLRKKVTSPKGTTEKAFDYIKKSNVGQNWVKAIMLAKKRSEELSV
ncbi:MAG: pyrroline-5-carboxylate reductase [bacterium]